MFREETLAMTMFAGCVAATLELKLPANATTYEVFTGSLTVAYAVDQHLNVTSATITLVELSRADDSVLSTVTSFPLPKVCGFVISGQSNLAIVVSNLPFHRSRGIRTSV